MAPTAPTRATRLRGNAAGTPNAPSAHAVKRPSAADKKITKKTKAQDLISQLRNDTKTLRIDRTVMRTDNDNLRVEIQHLRWDLAILDNSGPSFTLLNNLPAEIRARKSSTLISCHL